MIPLSKEEERELDRMDTRKRDLRAARRIVDEIDDQYHGDDSGFIEASKLDSHPFGVAMSQLSSALGVQAAIVLVTPIFAAVTIDPVTIRGAMFIMGWLVARAVIMLAHGARLQEFSMIGRMREINPSVTLSSNMHVAAYAFTAARLVATVWWFAIASGASENHYLEGSVTFLELILLTASFTFVRRALNGYVITT